MKRWNQLALGLCLAAATAACAGDRAPAGTATDDPAAVGTAGRDTKADADRAFVEDSITGGNAEVELGRLVQEKSKNVDVRQFAAMLIEHHTKAGAELNEVASRANIQTTPADDEAREEHDQLKERLGELSGAEFDREYIKAMVDNHEKAVSEAEDRSEDSKNDHVKQWAAQALPTLKKHLEQARQIQTNLEKAGA
jgi:putative membrane protein